MALNMCKMWSNGVKTAFFHKIMKNCPAAGGGATRPPQWYVQMVASDFVTKWFRHSDFVTNDYVTNGILSTRKDRIGLSANRIILPLYWNLGID